AKKTAQEKTYERLGDVDATKYDTKEALDTAKKAARNRQEMYLGNLPFKSSTLSFLLDDKAHRQTANKMAKDVLANQIDDNEKAQKEIDQKMKALAKNELAEALLSDSEKKEYAELKKQYNELQEKITEGKKAKGGKEWKKFLENVGKEVKENEGGGKPKEEPKTKPDDSGAKTT
ncbi:MAG: hypothetical protein NTZ38_00705, partial [Candidatus Taylorbacteria bacterium]|nr:hypothetical protein [Candidatus Taylorbacteria bacterium]